MNPSDYAWLMAGVAGVTAAWNQLKGFGQRFISYFYVSIELGESANSVIMSYLWNHAKLSPFSKNLYVADTAFIRPLDRYGMVAFRGMGDSMTFWLNRRPLFVSYKRDQANSYQLTAGYFRGTLNIEKLLIDAAAEWNHIDKNSNKKSGRYMVRRVMGRSRYKKMNTNNDLEKAPVSVGGAPSQQHGNRSIIPLGYTREDLVAPIQENPFSLLFYTPEVDDFIRQVENWFKSEDWYKSRNIPWRFGGSLFGPPGTGKTSLARAMAQALDIPIQMVDLTTMDNNDLVEAWAEMVGYAPCVVLLEDLDRVYDAAAKSDVKDAGPTLDCLLNCISGVEPANGILVIATANDITKLDPALGVPDGNGKSTRPGRLDVGVFLGPLTEEARRSVALRIMPTVSQDGKTTYDPKDYVDQLVKDGDGETGAQFTKRVADKALELYWRTAA